MASRKIVAPIAVGLCRDEYHRYFWEGDGPLVSVTTVEKILYSFPLERWKLEGVARRALRDLDILLPLRDRGDEEAAIRLLLDSKDPSFDARARGSAFHAWAESVNNAKPATVPDGLTAEAVGYLRWTQAARPKWLAIESLVASLKYRFGGTLDGVAEIDGQVWLLDIKTGKSVADRNGRVWDDMRMQLAAYANAEFIGRPGDPKKYRIPAIERYGIVHVTAAETRLVEAAVTRADWLAFLQALSLHRWKKESAA
jgi:PD-(D/E)XK nuclease superfamily